MVEGIELTIDAPAGIIDCRLDPAGDGIDLFTATILYPQPAGSYSRSQVYCHDLQFNRSTRKYDFLNKEDIHPRIVQLEQQISDGIIQHLKKAGLIK